jgi:hypothetical protein
MHHSPWGGILKNNSIAKQLSATHQVFFFNTEATTIIAVQKPHVPHNSTFNYVSMWDPIMHK